MGKCVRSFSIQGAKLVLAASEACDVTGVALLQDTVQYHMSLFFLFTLFAPDFQSAGSCPQPVTLGWLCISNILILHLLQLSSNHTHAFGWCPSCTGLWTVVSNGAWQATGVNNTSWLHWALLLSHPRSPGDYKVFVYWVLQLHVARC